MASLLTHAALPLVARRAAGCPPALARRLAVLAASCACAPDLDMVGYAFGLRSTDAWGHRGVTHSLVFAAVLALAVSALTFRALPRAAFWRVAAFLFAAIAAHGLLDAMTVGDVGVAFFAPFTERRYFLPLRLLPVCPLGVPEYFGRWGVAVVANELVYVLAPALLASRIFSAWRAPSEDRPYELGRWAATALAWVAVLVAVRTKLPDLFTVSTPRPIQLAGPAGSEEDPAHIPTGALPDGGLVTRFDELEARGLFDAPLAPAQEVWSSSFFPSWFGGTSGRWQEASPVLVWRTLAGMSVPAKADARRWLDAAGKGDTAAAQRLYRLSPTEKLDLALGDYSFAASRAALAMTHNGKPRFWWGFCNGVAAAAMEEPEPFRVVEVVNPEGKPIRFHPNDVKALLATAYYATRDFAALGGPCHVVAFDNGRICSMNPAGFVLALTNRLGIAHQSFLVDVIPTPQAQFYGIASATVHVTKPPYAPSALPADVAGEVRSLTDVQIDLTLSSTTLSYAAADRLNPARTDGTEYERVGLRPVSFRYFATLALGPSGELVGGRWNGDPPDGPDDLVFPGGGPLMQSDGGTGLEFIPQLPWPVIQRLARASVDAQSALPTVDLRNARDVAEAPPP